MLDFAILHQDRHYVAVDKPPGVLVHRMRPGETGVFMLQAVRDRIGQRVYPIHRLDRGTSGVLLFALSPEAAEAAARQFRERTVEKRYLAVVRGYTDEQGTIDYPLREEKWKERQPAVTRYLRLGTVQLDIPVGPFPTARYSLVEVRPETGRMHQIRKHFAHISHPLVGDTTHGEGRHNRLFRENFGCHRLLLTASLLGFLHPYGGQRIELRAPADPEWLRLFERLGWEWPFDG